MVFAEVGHRRRQRLLEQLARLLQVAKILQHAGEIRSARGH